MNNGHSTNQIPWSFIIEQIGRERFTPIISNQLVLNRLFGQDKIAPAWAEAETYPLLNTRDLSRVAQYVSVIRKDSTYAKYSYMRLLKERLFELASGEANAALTSQRQYLAQVKKQRRTAFSTLANDWLQYPHFAADPYHPLSILARLDIKVYVTTCHHMFMEAALCAWGKTPRTEAYCWRESQPNELQQAFPSDPDFVPNAKKTPLVFHLHGIDVCQDSMVLTEDDHLEFLIAINRDFNLPEKVPHSVRTALASSMLLLLGYDAQGRDLEMLLQGVIKQVSPYSRGIAIQIDPKKDHGIKDPDRFCEYLERYLDRVKFDIFWNSPEAFVNSLWLEWQGGE